MRIILILLLCLVALLKSEPCILCELLGDSSEEFESRARIVKAERDDFTHPTEIRRRIVPIQRGGDDDEELGGMISRVSSVSNIAQNLFGRLLGIVGDKIVKTYPASHFETSVNIRERSKPEGGVNQLEDNKKNSMSQSIFGLFDSLTEIPSSLQSQIDGPHICVREMNTRLENTTSTFKINKKCQLFRHGHRCINRRISPEQSTETTRIQECCEGYETDDILKGCTREIKYQSLNDFSDSHNVSFHSVDNGSTIFIDKNSNVFVVDEKISDYEMKSETSLYTQDKQLLLVSQPSHGYKTDTFINCAYLSKVNIHTEHNIVHIANETIVPAQETVLDILENDGRFNRFLSILSNASRALLESDSSEVTVLAFTDEVFQLLPERLQQQIINKKSCVEGIDRSHILKHSKCSHQLEESPLIALTGQIYHLEKLEDGKLKVGNAEIQETNLVARNGIVHIVDNLLMKEDFIPWDENLRHYNPELAQVLVDNIGDLDGPLTIFVPPSNNDTEIVNPLAYVVPGKLISLTHTSPSLLKTAGNTTIFAGRFPTRNTLSIRINTGNSLGMSPFQVGCSRVSRTSVFACNSVLHFLDKPLDNPKMTVSEFLSSRKDLDLFKQLFESSEEGKNNDFEHNFKTLFVPSNDSFSKNGFRRLIKNSEATDSFVKRHIIDKPLCEFDIRHQKNEIRVEIFQNKNGDGLRIQERGSDLFIEEAKIEEKIVLNDGVVYVLDSVVTKPERRFQPGSSMRSATDLLNIFH